MGNEKQLVTIDLTSEEAWTLGIDLKDDGSAVITYEKCVEGGCDAGDCQCSQPAQKVEEAE